jgi:hypothetical protein
MTSPQPARTVSGRPMASSRRIPPRSRRRSWTRTRAASENSTQTSVISISGFSVSGAEEGCTRSSATSAAPIAVNTMGAVRSARSNLAETAPHRKIAAATTMSADSCTNATSWPAADPPPLTGQGPANRRR